ncbi:uncharacterized protein LOC122389423 [Amphibalanus amphitrite]|uniref:uncharacterized protein LOC122389423 n=1 Tax=Amphibalanus amphitrite TaxID=1232801 RepID=UPI001C92A5DB|nr:uncharacterized protein LOC122389423 [Amphibalanus amphitrite]
MAAEGRSAAGGWWPAVCVLLCLALAALEVFHLQQTAELRHQLLRHRGRLDALEQALTDTLMESVAAVRLRRSVAAAQTSPAGIPIVSRPYGHRPADRPTQAPVMRVYDTFGASTDRPGDGRSLLPHHRSSAAFQGSRLGRVNVERRPEPRPTEAQALHHRKSRVKEADTGAKKERRARPQGERRRSKPTELKRLDAKRTKLRRMKARRLEEARGAPVGFSPGPSSLRASPAWPSREWGAPRVSPSGARDPYPDPEQDTDPDPEPAGSGGGQGHRGGSGGPRRGRRMQRMMEELRQALGTTAAHLEGHTTEYALGHPHYNGNGILRNAQPDSRFADWRFAPWVYTLGYSNDFTLHGGEITVKRPGVYYLYAQINYLDPGDINGFELLVSGRSFAKCLTMESTNHRQKVNTCHTSGVTYLDVGDSISVRDIERMRISMLLPDRSFFGLVRLAGTGGGDAGRRRRRSGPSTGGSG